MQPTYCGSVDTVDGIEKPSRALEAELFANGRKHAGEPGVSVEGKSQNSCARKTSSISGPLRASAAWAGISKWPMVCSIQACIEGILLPPSASAPFVFLACQGGSAVPHITGIWPFGQHQLPELHRERRGVSLDIADGEQLEKFEYVLTWYRYNGEKAYTPDSYLAEMIEQEYARVA